MSPTLAHFRHQDVGNRVVQGVVGVVVKFVVDVVFGANVIAVVIVGVVSVVVKIIDRVEGDVE